VESEAISVVILNFNRLPIEGYRTVDKIQKTTPTTAPVSVAKREFVTGILTNSVALLALDKPGAVALFYNVEAVVFK
jgi:hypothetical protein